MPIIEAVKRRVIGLFNAGLVGGEGHRDYLVSLGMSAANIFTGYNVVDNDYFRSRCQEVALSRARYAKQINASRPFLLCACRFVEKKNLELLVSAYHRYTRLVGPRSWDLILIGDGALRPQLNKWIQSRGLENRIRLAGAIGYGDLPIYYGLAMALVHPSKVEQWGLVVNEAMASGLPVVVSKLCGCAAELVRDGVNGYTFDPFDEPALATAMCSLHDDRLRTEMGRKSLDLISAWSPDRFANGLESAIFTAVNCPPRKARVKDLALLYMLANRPHIRAE
jgi:glycosyltransferase involved in cell wall biosynthesis